MSPLTVPLDVSIRMGGILIDAGALDRGGLERALLHCSRTGADLPGALAGLGLMLDEDCLKVVSRSLGVPYFTHFDELLDPEVSKILTEEECLRFKVVPIVRTGDALTLATLDPLQEDVFTEIRAMTGLQILPLLTTSSALTATIDRLYGVVHPVRELPVEDFVIAPAVPGAAISDDQSAIQVVDMVLREGFARKASDIHVESAKDKLRVRYRIDGVLHDAHVLPKEAEAAVVARIKIISKLDITETRLPQDGRFRHDVGGTPMDVRVSTLPSIYGEKVTMRLLMTGKLKRLEDLGFSPSQLELVRGAIRQPNGLLLVTGPTGSGKTSTLYSALSELNTTDVNIVTLEDPVEYRVDRINQIETNPKTGFTFAVGLRAILRQDPNVILVGEIRDEETAEIAVQAAVTGHLVMSTLHTSDAVSAVHRLVNLKIPPFLLAASLRMVVAQRLLRRLCELCRRPAAPTEDETVLLGAEIAGRKFFTAPGCEECFNTGYNGRIPVFEVFIVGSAVRESITRGSSLDELRAAAAADKLTTLHAEALRHAEGGVTSLSEVIRLTRGED